MQRIPVCISPYFQTIINCLDYKEHTDEQQRGGYAVKPLCGRQIAAFCTFHVSSVICVFMQVDQTLKRTRELLICHERTKSQRRSFLL